MPHSSAHSLFSSHMPLIWCFFNVDGEIMKQHFFNFDFNYVLASQTAMHVVSAWKPCYGLSFTAAGLLLSTQVSFSRKVTEQDGNGNNYTHGIKSACTYM